jgi:hypothetical protein
MRVENFYGGIFGNFEKVHVTGHLWNPINLDL